MGGYIYSVLAAAVFTAVILSIAPSGAGSRGIGKFVGFAGALCVALCVISPFCGEALSSLENFDFDFSEADKPSSDSAGEYKNEAECLARSCAVSFSVGYAVEMSDFTVSVVTDEGGGTFEIKELIIDVDGAFPAAENAEEKLSDIYGCDVSVISR